MAYTLCVALGIALAFGVRRMSPRAAYPHATALAAIACIGALGGALLCELPADWLGWTAPAAGVPLTLHRLGGRTVLGGLLGGWLAVELSKPALGIRVPTGDGFGAPLAIALACGRVGCTLTGCCPGRPVDPTAWWRGLARVAPDGVARFPAALFEALFHATAAAVLVLLARRGALAGRAFAAYVAVYCVVRVLLEELRDNPPAFGRWTYYQLLAVPLFVLAGATFARRSAARSAPASAAVYADAPTSTRSTP